MHPWETFVMVHCLGDVARNSSSLVKTIFTGRLVFMARRMAMYSYAYVSSLLPKAPPI